MSFGRDLAGELYLLMFAGRVLKIVVADQPAPPTAFSASVTGRTVTSNWVAPTAARRPPDIESTPDPPTGASNLAVLPTGPAPSLTVTNVPDGIYFVRAHSLRDSLAAAHRTRCAWPWSARPHRRRRPICCRA